MQKILAVSKGEVTVEGESMDRKEKNPLRQIVIDGKTIKKAMNERRKRDEGGFFLPREENPTDKLHIVSAFSVDD